MSPSFVIQTGTTNPLLRARSEVISASEMRTYVRIGRDMVRYVEDPDNKSCGLAAPQIGITKRLIAVSLMRDYDDEDYRTVMMINPTITEHSKETEALSEGCLSVPEVYGDVDRYVWMRVRYTDERGITVSLRLTGLAGEIVQHEIDHLDGILFTDKIVPSSPLLSSYS